MVDERNQNVRSMFVQNMDTLNLSNDHGIKNNFTGVISVRKLVIDQIIDIQARCDLSVFMSILKSWTKVPTETIYAILCEGFWKGF